MTIQSIVKMGNQQLRTPSIPVEKFATPELYELINNMQDTMNEKKGVGLAAPQIGCNLRVIMCGFEVNERYPDQKPVPFMVLINPVIKVLSQEMEDGWEGCLSVPGLRGLVPRYKKIQVEAFDPEGNSISQTAEGFHARIIQHECDHIDGISFPVRVKDMQSLGFEDELKDIIWPNKAREKVG